jgi:glutathione S-transferase
MILHWSPRSPFVRKVMIAAHELGLADQIACRRTVVSMTTPNLDLLPDNPLSKIPALKLTDGTVLIDSVVICEYLDSLAGGGKLFPPAGPQRWTELSRHALANGLLDILILWRNERDKAEAKQTASWLAAFHTKTAATLAHFEQQTPSLQQTRFGIASITLGICLSYLDFRFAFLDWRRAHPQLAAWHADFKARPSAVATEVVDDL